MKKLLMMLSIFMGLHSFAQTEMDGLMMKRNLFCAGITGGKSTWKNYWEGTLKRENLNLGKVSTSNIMVNGNYGITDRLNIIAMLPYIKTKASAGPLAGQKGLQDISVFIKWAGYQKQFKKAILKGVIVAGVSTPTTKYTADLLPLSIGTQSKTGSIRAMIDYQKGNWFGTASGSYIFRNNIKLDRNTYYTDRIHYTNEVAMPDAVNYNIRAGYRSETWIIEAVGNKWITNGGFDISKNNMPFVSNKMNATTIGFHIKYETNFIDGLSFIADGTTTIAGRNVGQTTGYNAGIFYFMNFGKKVKKTPVPNN